MIAGAEHDSDKMDGRGSGGGAEGCSGEQVRSAASDLLCKAFGFRSVHAHVEQESPAEARPADYGELRKMKCNRSEKLQKTFLDS